MIWERGGSGGFAVTLHGICTQVPAALYIYRERVRELSLSIYIYLYIYCANIPEASHC